MEMACVSDFEQFASEHLSGATWSFFALGSEREQTLQENLEVFKRYWFVPRVLRNVRAVDLSVQVLGEKLSIPIGLAPTAHQKMAHPDGEIAAARAAAMMGTVYTMSTISNTSLVDLSHQVPDSIKWMQIYIMKNRSVTEELVRKAESHGFKALVLTVDAPVPGIRIKGQQSLPQRSIMELPNISELFKSVSDQDRRREIYYYIEDELTWEDVTWLRRISKLPIVLKGILTAEDAKLAVEYGASAVWVSNHGGRQLDGTRATIDVLKDVAEALKGESNCEVYVDGGIRWGSDILKALALGARAVFIGRPLLWGLAHSGEKGVSEILRILTEELTSAMTLSGCRDLSEVGPSLLYGSLPSDS